MSTDDQNRRIYSVQDLLYTDIYFNPNIYQDREIAQGILTKSPLSKFKSLSREQIRLHPQESINGISVQFSWSYRERTSPLFHNRIQAQLNEIDDQVRKVIFLQGFLIGVLIPLWIVHYMQEKEIARLLVEKFKAVDPKDFLPKGTVISKSLHFLNLEYPVLYSTLCINGVEWEAIFFVCNETVTRYELELNIKEDKSMIEGMQEWVDICRQVIRDSQQVKE